MRSDILAGLGVFPNSHAQRSHISPNAALISSYRYRNVTLRLRFRRTFARLFSMNFPPYFSANLFTSASFTHAGTNCDTSPCRLAISRTIDEDKYMYCGGDMMNSVSSAWFNW